MFECDQSCLFLCFKNAFEKYKKFYFYFLLQINIYLMFLDYFDVLILKIILKNKKSIILIHF